jgi:chaperonin cofactor prefoldin
MSKTCGDTARYHRLRKQRIRMRARIQKLREEIAARAASNDTTKPAK